MPPLVSKLLFIVISNSSIFHSWREFLCSIVGKEANCPWHWTKCSAWLRPLLNVLIAAGCTLTAIHAPLNTHTGVSAHFQPAPTLSFYRLFFSLFVVLATFISTAYHGQATGAKVLYSKNPAGLFYWYSRGELLWWSRYDNAMQNAPEAFCVTAPCWRSIQAEVSLSIIFEYLDHNIQRLVLENIAILGDKKHGELSLCR